MGARATRAVAVVSARECCNVSWEASAGCSTSLMAWPPQRKDTGGPRLIHPNAVTAVAAVAAEEEDSVGHG